MKKVIKIGVCFVIIFSIYPVAAQLDSEVPVPSIKEWIEQHPTPEPVQQPNRFVDNGNGTITDKKTGLIWLKNANCFGRRDLQTALNLVKNLADGQCGLTDGSTPSQWRLPDMGQLASLLDYGIYAADMPAGHPFSKVRGGRRYWSSTSATFAN